MSRYGLARFLQLIGLVILPFGILSELQGMVGLGRSLLIAASGMGVFYLGYRLEHQS